MITIPLDLPVPTSALQVQSDALCQLIREEINRAASLSFSRFMTLALYEPTWGYYTAGLEKLGKRGDFITAPEISPLFSQCVGRQYQQIVMHLGQSNILEIGAGTGQMAVDLLLFLEQQHSLPDTYMIFEMSPTLKQRQQERLKQAIPHLFPFIQWLDDWPKKPIKGVILVNEVVDALPVDRFVWHGECIYEQRVSYKKGRFCYQLSPVRNGSLLNQLTQLKKNYFLTTPIYQSEVCQQLEQWVNKLSDALEQGVAFIMDYGYTAKEYYHADKVNGTLRCYYQHRVHQDPLTLVGLQDITASVDFSRLAHAAVHTQFKVAGYIPQAAFLLNNDLLPLVEKCYDGLSSLDVNRQVHLLTSPSEMGELVKVMGLTRNCDFFSLNGFKFYDKRMRL